MNDFVFSHYLSVVSCIGPRGTGGGGGGGVGLPYKRTGLPLISRDYDGTEREAQGVGRDMSCPRKLVLAQWKSCFSDGSLFSERSACSLVSLSGS